MPRRPDSPASVLRAGEAHHGLPVHEVVLLLETDPDRGLAGDEAARRLDRFGPNTFPAAARGGPLLRALRQFHHPLIYILIAAGAVTAALGESVDSAVIFAVVLINAFVGFAQESRAEAALDSLRSMVRTTARVVRDGHERAVPSEDLAPGDLVLVEAGDKVPADVRLLRAVELRADESALTGESVPVAKDEVLLDPLTPVADRRNTLHSGTLVTAGRGAGVAVSTGAGTELGEIHRLVGAAEVLTTPLTEKLARFSRVLTVVILVLAAATFAIGLVRGQGASGTFTAAVALAVGAIPEGLPAVVTITLAIGVSRMARRRAVIRRLPAVETLGSTTVICSDKTGTLTENQMTVRAVWTPDGEFSVTGSGYAPDGEFRRGDGGAVPVAADRALYRCLLAGALCNDAVLTGGAAESGGEGRWSLTGDPTEGALMVAAAKGGLGPDATVAFPRVGTVPFSSERRYMATVHRDEAAGGHLLLVKGAVERIVELCSGGMGADGAVRPLDREAVLRAAGELAGRGLRVLATAELPGVEPEGFGDGALPDSMVFTGLQAMLDPPRAAAVDAVRACRTAGIGVKMITGDHAATATAVAGRIGLLTGRREGEVLTGADLDALPARGYPDAVERARVFARVSPEQKLWLVEALQARGQVVAMTGDGVNDAPALRQANIGVAMGRGGTEVAKDAADMVLTDDDFATIEAAVEEGRGVFDNLVKFIVWVLPTSLGQGMLVLVAIVFGATLPVLPTQILWINMTTAVALGLMLAFEPKEEGIMRRPPRDPGRPLLTTGLALRVLLVSALIVGGAWWLFTWELAEGAGLAEARTAAVNLVVAVELFYLFSCRSLTRSVWSAGVFGNRWIVGGVLAQTVGQLAITYLPAMNRLFHTAPISGTAWLRILGVALLASLAVAVDKRLRRQLV
ncbi:HAD-IC family P-type ATPase [Streptomyces verrucosisporus]|uniref:HAD-IC family P-type ATPase n=1 Tax=Streptomyces verrucosisporus TaxID=1695161 RepID=UPI0019D22BB9|nr:HAD-IC family P-type ATPase [Streptomyces verrucosisporus]MBN3932362.1 HAD-IC family P-type ATPase [Streptomyces verrucosisporus]